MSVSMIAMVSRSGLKPFRSARPGYRPSRPLQGDPRQGRLHRTRTEHSHQTNRLITLQVGRRRILTSPDQVRVRAIVEAVVEIGRQIGKVITLPDRVVRPGALDAWLPPAADGSEALRSIGLIQFRDRMAGILELRRGDRSMLREFFGAYPASTGGVERMLDEFRGRSGVGLVTGIEIPTTVGELVSERYFRGGTWRTELPSAHQRLFPDTRAGDTHGFDQRTHLQPGSPPPAWRARPP